MRWRRVLAPRYSVGMLQGTQDSDASVILPLWSYGSGYPGHCPASSVLKSGLAKVVFFVLSCPLYANIRTRSIRQYMHDDLGCKKKMSPSKNPLQTTGFPGTSEKFRTPDRYHL